MPLLRSPGRSLVRQRSRLGLGASAPDRLPTRPPASQALSGTADPPGTPIAAAAATTTTALASLPPQARSSLAALERLELQPPPSPLQLDGLAEALEATRFHKEDGVLPDAASGGWTYALSTFGRLSFQRLGALHADKATAQARLAITCRTPDTAP